MFRPYFHQQPAYDERSVGESVASVPIATLGNNDSSPTERRTNFQSMNTDARTCKDVITELGYPYEAIRVETADGYVLLLERIPRRDSKKVLYLQHGILDSSMGLLSRLCCVVGGDSSNWVGVLGIPHYNMDDMPGVSFRVAQHLAQIKHAKKFIMYDYGSPSANMKIYGSPRPIDLGENYGLIDIPVDLVAGKKDKVIRPSMVKRHYRLMKNAGVEVSYNEYEYAHLDFTFSHHEELLAYVMSRLLLLEG
ncbi:hypothetical protein QQ045_021199 [Rhodiola kirilowii]